MTEQQIIDLMNQPYNADRWQDYRRGFIYYNPTANVANCNCNAGGHFNYLKIKLREIENEKKKTKDNG